MLVEGRNGGWPSPCCPPEWSGPENGAGVALPGWDAHLVGKTARKQDATNEQPPGREGPSEGNFW